MQYAHWLPQKYTYTYVVSMLTPGTHWSPCILQSPTPAPTSTEKPITVSYSAIDPYSRPPTLALTAYTPTTMATPSPQTTNQFPWLLAYLSPTGIYSHEEADSSKPKSPGIQRAARIDSRFYSDKYAHYRSPTSAQTPKYMPTAVSHSFTEAYYRLLTHGPTPT